MVKRVSVRTHFRLEEKKCNINFEFRNIHQVLLCQQDLFTWTVVLVHLRLDIADQVNE